MTLIDNISTANIIIANNDVTIIINIITIIIISIWLLILICPSSLVVL